MIARIIVAAPGSGSGKTLISAGLIRALAARGLRVQPFKCGPDYIDPGYLSLAAGRACRNLDSWLLGPATTCALFAHGSAACDLAVIEGVMGLFDGYGALDDSGSTAEIARLLDAPVVLVVDARGMARSAAALVEGFGRFDPRVRVAGVLLNRVGSARHAELCAQAIQARTGLPCVGYLPRDATLTLPERHLGLVTTREHAAALPVIERAAAILAETCDLDALLALAHSAPRLAAPSLPETRRVTHRRRVIAVAQDEAFSFIYPETCELLRAAGAEIVPFSPLRDADLPPHSAGVMLSGGFPELYAAELSGNASLLAALRRVHAAGVPIYAECGGLMALTEALVDQDGRRWPMAGLLPGTSVMTTRLTLGYRVARALRDGPLLPAGEVVRGHEFHYSRWVDRPDQLPAAYTLLDATGQAVATEGAQHGSLLATYVHLHWLARPAMAERFVAWCSREGTEHGSPGDVSGRRA